MAHSAAETIEPPAVETEKPADKPRADEKRKRQPPYAVILHNDDVNGFDFVIGVLRKVLKIGYPKARLLTMQAHVAGRSAVWTGVLEVAELKADQIRSCGPDPMMKERGAQTLRVTVEPLPR
jgi:ATP-dependent Clp protease adaptor protein ClpS